jgi:hypothetical protein
MWSQPNVEPRLIESLLQVPVNADRVFRDADILTFSEIASTNLLTSRRTSGSAVLCVVLTAVHVGAPNAPSPAMPRRPVSTLRRDSWRTSPDAGVRLASAFYSPRCTEPNINRRNTERMMFVVD